jgi:hypothetical protein
MSMSVPLNGSASSGMNRRQPAVGDLHRLLDRLRPHRAEVDRDALLHRARQQLQRLAEPVRVHRQPELPTFVLERRLPGQRRPHDLHVLARARQRPGERNAVPALGHLRARHAKPEPEAAAREHVERGGGHRGHGRGAARDLHQPGAERHALRDRAQVAEHRHRVLAPRLGDPHRVEPGLVGLAGKSHLLLG